MLRKLFDQVGQEIALLLPTIEENDAAGAGRFARAHLHEDD